MVAVDDLGANRKYLVHSHMSGVARPGAAPEHRVEALLVYRDQLAAELRQVESELATLARSLHGAR